MVSALGLRSCMQYIILASGMRGNPIRIRLMTTSVAILATLLFVSSGQTQSTDKPDPRQASAAAVKQYCATCHAAAVKTAGVVIDPAELAQGGDPMAKNAELWERV